MPLQITKIEWCTHTWNPVTGCYHDCPYCYARGIARRFGGHYIAARGENDYPAVNRIHMVDEVRADGSKIRHHQPFVRCVRDEQIMTKAGTLKKAPYPYGFIPTLHEGRLNDPARHKQPAIVFVGSMCDLFGEWVPDNWIEQVFEACAAAPQHKYLFLTKNPERYEALATAGLLPDAENMYFGSTITTPDDAHYYGGLHTSRKRFLSIEPVLAEFEPMGRLWTDWVIVGAETGKRKGLIVPKRRWINNICEQADFAGVPVFMKESLVPIMGEGNMRREWPAELRR